MTGWEFMRINYKIDPRSNVSANEQVYGVRVFIVKKLQISASLPARSLIGKLQISASLPARSLIGTFPRTGNVRAANGGWFFSSLSLRNDAGLWSQPEPSTAFQAVEQSAVSYALRRLLNL